MENSLSLYSVNRNKESFGDVDMGRLMVRGEGKAKAFHGILIREAGSESVAVPIFLLEMEDLPVWRFVLFINPHSKRSWLFLCSYFCCHIQNNFFTCVTL